MFYSTNPLDRADKLRKIPAEIENLWAESGSRLFLFHELQPLVRQPAGEQTGQHLFSIEPSRLAQRLADAIFLGLSNCPDFPGACFALAVDEQEITELSLPDNVRPTDLRKAGPTMPADEGTILAYGRAMLFWHQTHRHCTRCGTATETRAGGHTKYCSSCSIEAFPRTDPAVIMLVTDGQSGERERCLLGRHPAWPVGVYSTLAGFVEPGESLEHAVRREVMEEAGVAVGDVRYVASQPWPFPQSIMLGFQGIATSTHITLDPVELADARWFSRDELAQFGSWGDSRYALQMPRKDSIARHLIDQWLEIS